MTEYYQPRLSFSSTRFNLEVHILRPAPEVLALHMAIQHKMLGAGSDTKSGLDLRIILMNTFKVIL